MFKEQFDSRFLTKAMEMIGNNRKKLSKNGEKSRNKQHTQDNEWRFEQISRVTWMEGVREGHQLRWQGQDMCVYEMLVPTYTCI